MGNPYTAAFYRKDLATVQRSAERIAPLVMNLLAPRSVIDIGCGVGTWLSVFASHGVNDFLGIDGDYVKRDMLQIPLQRFQPADLQEPLHISRRYDLAMSLEVAEHLPESSAAAFIGTLCSLSDVVLFSAAAPRQGGAHHVNERWPDYWAKFFAEQGYTPIDAIRPHVWDDPQVQWWYAQNTLLFARRPLSEALQKEQQQNSAMPLSVVHPRMYEEQHDLQDRLTAAASDLASVLQPGESCIVVDEEQIRPLLMSGYRACPLIHQNGVYWGAPQDDAVAIDAFEAQRPQARHIVFAWPAFWWLQHYPRFAAHLRQACTEVLRNERLIICAISP